MQLAVKSIFVTKPTIYTESGCGGKMEIVANRAVL